MSRRLIRPVDVAAALLLALGVACFARAQSDPPPAASSEPAHAEPDSDANTLAGPSVARSAEPTLVTRTFEGRLIRLDIWPEEAAVARLQLTPEARARIDDILAARAAAFGSVVTENLEALQKLVTDAEGGRWFGALTHLRAFQRKINDRLADARPLIDQFAQALPAEQAEHLRTMVQQYWDALIAEEVGDALHEFGGGLRASATRLAEELRVFGEELGRAYERIENTAAVYAEYFIQELGFTGQNARHVRDAVRDFLSQVDDPEAVEEREWIPMIRDLYKKLDAAGRERLFEYILEQG